MVFYRRNLENRTGHGRYSEVMMKIETLSVKIYLRDLRCVKINLRDLRCC